MSRRQWRAVYGRAVDGPHTIECGFCDSIVAGDSPALVVMCYRCWQRYERQYYKSLGPKERPKRGSLDEDFHKLDWIDAVSERGTT